LKYYIIAGEASGDLHGANLIKAVHKLDSGAEIRCWGGDLMEAAGAVRVKHYRDMAFMGFLEVIKNLPAILRNIAFCKKDISDFKPDVIVLIDYPGFNMRIAAWAKENHFKVIYYVSPQIWAWKQNRVHALKRDVNRMLCVLPFEKDFYARFNWKVDFVGHPLIDAIAEESLSKTELDLSSDRPVIAILPGSRSQEIQTKLPLMLEATASLGHYQVVVAGAPGKDPVFYESMMKKWPDVKIVFGQTYALLKKSHAALVTSGTATLETALFGVPQVVCYKGNTISYEIARRLIKVKYISLVNLIMDKEVVKELIQNELTVLNIRKQLESILHGEERNRMLIDYSNLRRKLGGEGASENAAAIVVEEAAAVLNVK
jgi:lipid-A-disaccharide synthase